jgi:NAD(P)-dependent dehydrogenase (short-subunit alcohol dehydrogenase family)
MRNYFDLSGRVAVVVGATSGLGKAIAIGLAAHGADVVPTGRRPAHVEEVCGEIEAAGKRTMRQTTDVTDRQSIDVLRDAVLARFGRIDILVNAAGYTSRQPAVEIEEEKLAGIFDTNLSGALRACQSFYAPLKASGRGRVINIASLGSFLAFRDVAAYCASKSALLSLTRSLGCEWARDGISVNAIVPGIFPTELNRELINDSPRGRELLMRTPMGRFGRPEELTGAAVLLASDGASFITGQSIAVDGGYLASGVNS